MTSFINCNFQGPSVTERSWLFPSDQLKDWEMDGNCGVSENEKIWRGFEDKGQNVKWRERLAEGQTEEGSQHMQKGTQSLENNGERE